MSSNGKCIIVSAPSGAGKTTIVKYLLGQDLGLQFSISATSRSPRADETEAQDYYFLSAKTFEDRIASNDFIEWEEVYPGQYYGTLKSEIQRVWEQGATVIFDVDVIGGLNLKEHFGDKALALFIQPPNIQALEDRLTARRSESAETLKLRLDKAAQELAKADEFDKIVVNVDLDEACSEARDVVSGFIEA